MNSRRTSTKPAVFGAEKPGRGQWRFDGDVPATFDSHIERSIPEYHTGHELVVQTAQGFFQENSTCYELGCSTGTLTRKLANIARHSRSKVVGLDQVEDMLKIARQRCSDLDNVELICADATQYLFSDAAVCVSYYTLQFIPVAIRPSVVAKIFQCLGPGGAFILFEKICFSDPDEDKAVTQQYFEYKRSQGFTEQEIKDKAASLEGILVPQTGPDNIAMLKQCGFDQIEVVFEHLCWHGYLAIKSNP